MTSWIQYFVLSFCGLWPGRYLGNLPKVWHLIPPSTTSSIGMHSTEELFPHASNCSSTSGGVVSRGPCTLSSGSSGTKVVSGHAGDPGPVCVSCSSIWTASIMPSVAEVVLILPSCSNSPAGSSVLLLEMESSVRAFCLSSRVLCHLSSRVLRHLSSRALHTGFSFLQFYLTVYLRPVSRQGCSPAFQQWQRNAGETSDTMPLNHTHSAAL